MSARLLVPGDQPLSPTLRQFLTQVSEALAGLQQRDDDHFYAHPAATDLTESTATGVVRIPLTAGQMVGGRLEYTIEVSDGTELQVLVGMVRFAAVNKDGRVTTNSPPTQIGTEWTSGTAGTLSNTVTAVAGDNEVTLKLNTVSSLVQTTLRAFWRIWWHGAVPAVTPL